LADAGRVRGLEELGARDVELAGGKGANLGELVRGGFRVPPGFVVTTDVHAGAEHDSVPPDAAAEIAEAYARIGSPPVAVRSSATAEDSPGASFAGQYATFLDVQGAEAVVDAVARCWRSLTGERAVAYGRERGVEGTLRIAVVVQEMAPHESAGVVFTVNPLSGDRGELLVNAARGSGEALVGGEVVPDSWVARRPDGAVLSFTPAPRGVPRTAGARALPVRPSLTSDRVRDLARLALRVEAHFGGVPQDIEWSYGGGAFHLLQARPITTISLVDER
jgi:pyruvate,water dikinase